MKFETDKQTLEDLNLLGKYKNNSIYSLYGGIITRGGEHRLEEMFLHPLDSVEEINDRASVFCCFRDHDFPFPFGKEEYDTVEQYLNGGIHTHGGMLNVYHLLKCRAMQLIANDLEFDFIRGRILLTIQFLLKVIPYLNRILAVQPVSSLEKLCRRALALSNDSSLERILAGELENPGLMRLIVLDRFFRGVYNQELRELLNILEQLDVYSLVGGIAREQGFHFAMAKKDGETLFRIKGLRHPRVKGAVANDLEITMDKNVFFLTGANMAGKSTLMKSFGVAVYLAHMGFPLAVDSMEFRVQDGMYTSINVPDNIAMGYSHFYAEVLRVKKVAIEISKDKRLVVIFDELFKGTNVKDAFDATLAVTEAIAGRRYCTFMVSTHIIEVGEELAKRCDNVRYHYLPTVMDGKVPRYTYKLEEGITSDKHGMIIINNEKIIETIQGEI